MKGLPSLDRLIRILGHVPYLASKNVYRVAAFFLSRSDLALEQFCMTLLEAKKNIVPCVICFNLSEGCDTCAICMQSNRIKTTICVVETWHDLFAIEKAGGFDGVYHVLGGALCPLDGIGPEKLTIEQLIARIHAAAVTELIFATNPTPEGEATASYIASKLKNNSVVISKLASGMPIGSSLEHMDRITIFKALSGRRPF